ARSCHKTAAAMWRSARSRSSSSIRRNTATASAASASVSGRAASGAAAGSSGAAAADEPAAAPATDRPDTDADAVDAVAVLRRMLDEERERADRHMAAAVLWQERARVLEGRLLALGAGDIPADAPARSTRVDDPDESRPATGASVPRWRRWLRRVVEGP
ncbi:MAG: hypothetical protein M3Q10_04725, partial [Chloroflexota bacterium]|nr:hypothetical protein [Chloroflexota bacterium]